MMSKLKFAGWRNVLVTAAAVTAMAALSGCHKKASGVNPATLGPTTDATGSAPTATISADPLSIDLGQSVVLNWRTSGATAVTIDGIGQVPVNGTQTVSPSNSTNFHLVAKSDSGASTEASVRVAVRVAAAPSAPTADTSGDMGSDAAFHQAVPDAFFDYDSYELRPDAQGAASSASAYLASHPAIRVVIGGYSDERGSAEYNLALGENRANAARQALLSAGIAPSRLRVVSYGKEKQFCSESTESCWQQNRRAQFSLDR